jgi:hypothetical protein
MFPNLRGHAGFHDAVSPEAGTLPKERYEALVRQIDTEAATVT